MAKQVPVGFCTGVLRTRTGNKNNGNFNGKVDIYCLYLIKYRCLYLIDTVHLLFIPDKVQVFIPDRYCTSIVYTCASIVYRWGTLRYLIDTLYAFIYIPYNDLNVGKTW